MKKLLIAASIFSSFSAMATLGVIPLSFSVDSNTAGVKSCSIYGIYNENASLAFYDDGGFEGNHYSQVLVKSTLIEKIKTKVSSTWASTEAWNGVVPKSTIYFDHFNRFNNNHYETDDLSFEQEAFVNSGIDVETTYDFKVRTEKPTHNGLGKLDMVVQFECE